MVNMHLKGKLIIPTRSTRSLTLWRWCTPAFMLRPAGLCVESHSFDFSGFFSGVAKLLYVDKAQLWNQIRRIRMTDTNQFYTIGFQIYVRDLHKSPKTWEMTSAFRRELAHIRIVSLAVWLKSMWSRCWLWVPLRVAVLLSDTWVFWKL